MRNIKSRRVSFACMLVVVIGFAGGQDYSTSKENMHSRRRRSVLPTADEAQIVLDAHNEARATISDEGEEPMPSNMRYMTWDDQLAVNSLNYAKKCVWGHSPVPSRRTPKFNAINGENLWCGNGPLTKHFSPLRAVSSWFNEYEYYEFYNQTCVPGKKCGHYTQVVWATTYKLGCAWTLCPLVKHTGLTEAMYMVCQYAPVGNIRGRKLYKVGERCSECEEGDTCPNGTLCHNAERDKLIPIQRQPDVTAGVLISIIFVLAALAAAGYYLYVKYGVPSNVLLAWRKRRRVSSAAELKNSQNSQDNNNEDGKDDACESKATKNYVDNNNRGARLASINVETCNSPD